MDTTLRDPLVGQLLDHRYRVESRIAVGGMATVYRAVDTRLDRTLALKVMHPNLAVDETFTARFIREAKAVARLSHANVVGVFDQGRDGDRVFLAMEFIDGCTLRDVLRARGGLSPRVALDILEPVVAALGAAHRAGLVHRDVKPENVLIAADGRVKVADFGLVRAVSSDTAGTTAGTVLGTVAYLAPEQLEHGTADRRTDVFACGLLLYELLTGVRAQEGSTPSQLMYKRLHEAIPAPSERLPGLAPALDALVSATTAHDPDDRPADAVALLAEVQRLRRGLTEEQLDREPPPPPDAPAGGAATAATVAQAGAAAAAGGEVSGPVPVPPADHAGCGTGAGDGSGSGSGSDVQHTRIQQRLPADLVMPAPIAEDPPPGGGGPARRRFRWRPPHPVRALVVLAAVVVVGGGVLWWSLAGRYTPAPSLLGASKAQAQQRLDRAGLHPSFRTRFSESVDRGHVVSAAPKAGADVRKGGRVTVVLSKGPERHDVPKLKGRTAGDAEKLLKERHLIVGSRHRAYSEDVPSGRVVSTSPSAGARLAPGTAVDLTVSRGRPPVDVPDVTGEDASHARADLKDAGFVPVVSPAKVASSDVDKGKIARQKPGSGTAPKGSKVTLYVSKGPQMVKVPDVTGEKVDQAKKELEGAGFKPRLGFALFGGDTVKGTDPEAGTKAPKGSTVTIDTGGL